MTLYRERHMLAMSSYGVLLKCYPTSRETYSTFLSLLQKKARSAPLDESFLLLATRLSLPLPLVPLRRPEPIVHLPLEGSDDVAGLRELAAIARFGDYPNEWCTGCAGATCMINQAPKISAKAALEFSRLIPT